MGSVAFAPYGDPGGYAQTPNSYPASCGWACPPGYPQPGVMPQPAYGPGYPTEDVPEVYAPRWTITAGAIFLHSIRPPALLLIRDFLDGPELVDVRDVAPHWGEGPRIDAIYRCASDWGVELLYYGISNWERDQSLHSDLGALYLPLLSQSLTYDDASATANTDLYNAEFNVRREITSNITVLLGFRFLELLDRLSLSGSFPSESDSLSTRVSNALYGLQVGADVKLGESLKKGIYLDCLVKGGVYDNYVTRTETQSGTIGYSNAENNLDHVAFIGEVAFLPTWDISKHFSVFGGYEALWLQGVAIASQEIGSTQSIRASRVAFYEGAVAGVTARW